MQFTKSELEVMNVLWKAGRPLSRSEILSMSTEKTWKDSSIHILLNGLLRKKAIEEAGRVRSGKTMGRLYAPTISCGDYYTKNVFAGNKEALPLLFSAFVKSEGVTQQQLDELEQMLEKRRRELE